jgi:RNA polymerase sigma factor for flagellar operon FliA
VGLWEEFKLKASADARERLILHHAPLVKYVVGRVSVGPPPNIEQADLVAYGIFGLIDAIEKYDLERGVKFEAYAISRIKGAIIDELRAIDRIPRSVRFKAREVEKAYVALENRLHRSPTDAEVAQQVGITTDELQPDLLRVGGRPRRAALGRLRARRPAQPGRHPGGQGAPRTRWPCSSPRR